MPRKQSRKRANGDGSIFQKSDGTWFASVTLGYRNGRRVRKNKMAKSRHHARQLLIEMQGVPSTKEAKSGDINIHDYLKFWLEEIVKPDKAPSTYVNYERSIRLHILPNLRKVKLIDLAAPEIILMLNNVKSGTRTREIAYDTMTAALKSACRLGFIEESPCKRVPPPKHKTMEIVPFTPEESRAIIEASKKHVHQGVVLLAFHLGLRQGEIFGVQPGDVNLKSNTLSVRRQITRAGKITEPRELKTKSSRRTLQMPEIVSEFFRKNMDKKNTWVFRSRTKEYLSASAYRNTWKLILRDANVEHRGFHHTRHTFATMMLANKVPVHVVSKILGHSRPTITINTYAHFLEVHHEEVAEVANSLY